MCNNGYWKCTHNAYTFLLIKHFSIREKLSDENRQDWNKFVLKLPQCNQSALVNSEKHTV